VKRSTVNGFIILSVLIWVIFGMTLFKVDRESPSVTRILASTSMAALVHLESRFNQTTSDRNPNQCFIIRENGGPAFNSSLIGKQSLSVWGNITVPKQPIQIGFFFSAMVLLLFIRFYQSSRTSSEDPDSLVL
jgi:hypothetical protein